MENDIQLILYIVFGIIYLIFNVLKKRRAGKEQSGTPPIFPEDEPGAGDGTFHQEPTSLEELLERYEQAAQRGKRRASEKIETMQGQGGAAASRSDDPGQPVYRNLEAEALEQMQRTERLKSMQEELPASARAEMLNKELPRPKSYRAKPKPRRLDENLRKRRMHKKKEEPGMAEQLRQLAGTRKGMQQAVILSEILNRKYF